MGTAKQQEGKETDRNRKGGKNYKSSVFPFQDGEAKINRAGAEMLTWQDPHKKIQAKYLTHSQSASRFSSINRVGSNMLQFFWPLRPPQFLKVGHFIKVEDAIKV